MPYVDGFIVPVPEDRLEEYKRLARKVGKVYREHGALEYVECVGDDLDAKHGTPFPKKMKTKPGETVLFSWVLFKSRAHRDQVNAKVMKDPRMTKMMEDAKGDMPFDPKRMLYGGFKSLMRL